jgi:hypothetical protein
VRHQELIAVMGVEGQQIQEGIMRRKSELGFGGGIQSDDTV